MIYKITIKCFCNAFNDRRIFENIAFAFTKFYEKENINKENCVKLFEQIKNKNDNFYWKYNGQYSFKRFFVDSDLDKPDDDSLIEKENIIECAKEQPYIY